MAVLDLRRKLQILADAAKYDASCASSGAARRNSRTGRGMGSTDGKSICHAFTPDGRCVSLLKVLLTNFCIWDCAYCVNRVSSNVERARFAIDEIVELTLNFYRRNYIEGLFLSSGVIRNADYTMEQLTRVARTLRQDHDFRGYIHLKLIPEASVDLVREAGLWADRLSANVELPRAEALGELAPQKSAPAIARTMGAVRVALEESRPAPGSQGGSPRFAPGRFAPAGQSTQMVVGADGASDTEILIRSESLYSAYALKRVYFSAFSPIPDSSAKLPVRPAPLMREHRLYQADWLMRFYGFARSEITDSAPGGLLDLEIDPKLAWALSHRDRFPVDVNRADRELLLRVPGLGVRSVDRLIEARRYTRITLADIGRLGRTLALARPFIIAADWTPGSLTDRDDLRSLVKGRGAATRQLQLL